MTDHPESPTTLQTNDEAAAPSRGDRSRWAFAPLLVWAAVLFGLSSIPGPALPAASQVVGLDKVTHAVLYGAFGLLCSLGVARRLPTIRIGGLLLLVTVASVVYGITDEIHQIFVAGRSADWHDVVADGAGGSLGALAFAFLQRRRRSKHV